MTTNDIEKDWLVKKPVVLESWLTELEKVSSQFREVFEWVLDNWNWESKLIFNWDVDKILKIRWEKLNPDNIDWDDWRIWEMVFWEILEKFWDYRFWKNVLVTSISWPWSDSWTIWFKKIIEILEISPATPVILVDNNFTRDGRFDFDVVEAMQKLVKYPNVRIFSMKEFFQRWIKNDDDWKNTTNEEIRDIMLKNLIYWGRTWMDNSLIELKLSGIRHDLWHALNGVAEYNKDKLINMARWLGLSWTDEEITDQVMNNKINKTKNKEFMGTNSVFIDWDGTLFKDWKFKKELFEEAYKLAKDKWISLSIWTGWAEINNIYQVLEQNKIFWFNVCSKQDCNWLEISFAFDDLEKNKLEEEYWVKILEYIQV